MKKIAIIIVILLLGIMVACTGCGRGSNRTPLSKDVHTLVLISRSLDTGRFRAFEITDRALLEQILSALKEDLRHRDKHSDEGITMSVNHVLVFCGKDGKSSVYDILGDDFIVSGSNRYPARQTITVMQAIHAQAGATAISAERAKHLVPEWVIRFCDMGKE